MSKSGQPGSQAAPDDERYQIAEESDAADFRDAEAATGASSQQPAPAETRDEELERLRHEVEQANKHALQAQAEAENFRKRMRRDIDEQLRFACWPLISDLLQVRDNLFRALEAAAASEHGGPVSGLRDGVAMCAKQLDDMLVKHGVSEIPAEGEEFDPNVHEAISQMSSDTHPAGTVMHVAVSGFRLHERVVRPSQVVVSSGPAGSSIDS